MILLQHVLRLLWPPALPVLPAVWTDGFVASPQQELMIQHLLDHPEAALFCGVGLGKTLATLEAIATLIRSGEIRAAMVIAPLRVARMTWPEEASLFARHRWMKVVNLRTEAGMKAWREGSAHIYLTHYDVLPSRTIPSRHGGTQHSAGIVEQCFHGGQKLPIDMLIWDESSKLKQFNGVRGNTLVPFHSMVKRHVIMTGTPAPNSYMDLFNQFRILDGGKILGKHITQFRQHYFTQGWTRYKWEINEGSEEAIQKRIAPITLSLKSEDWLKIPPTTVHDVEVRLPKAVHKLYRQMERELIMTIGEHDILAANAAVLTGKLLQITSGAVYDGDRIAVPMHSAKLDALKALLKKLDRPVLLAVNYVHEKEIIMKQIPGAELFDETQIGRWNAGKIKCFVANPQSIGHGLNLQKGSDTIVWFTPTYSQELYEQMNGRLIRRGQVKPTHVYRLICVDTIDEAVIEALRKKGKQQGQLLTALKYLKRLRKAA